MIIPTGARNIEIVFTSPQNVTLSLKERDTNLGSCHVLPSLIPTEKKLQFTIIVNEK